MKPPIVRPRAHCRRCKGEVEVEVPWRGWVHARRVWIASVVGLCVITPVVAADAIIMTPMALALLMGGGALNERAEQVPRCRRCQLEIALEPALSR